MSSIPREHIDPDADKVVRRLKRHGFEAYLVGGCVRDLLLARRPKDFDVATSATPPETKDLFRNCRIIGRRFRLAHIFFGQKIIETSTFRQNPREGVDIEEVEELLIRRDNVFGNAEEDARRRDFTINGLFYDVEAEQVIDYVGGRADLEARLVRTIGDPDIRFREDPVRILRAVKFAARLDFQIEPLTYAAILSHRGEIPKCAAPRVLEEVYRLLRGGAAKRSMELLLTTGVAATLAPELAWMFGGEAAAAAGLLPADQLPPWLAGDATLAEEGRARAWRMLEILDGFVAAGSPEPVYHGQPTNALLISMLVAPFLPELFAPAKEKEERINDLSERIESLIRPLSMRLRVSRRDAERARQVLLALRRLVPGRRRRARPMALVRRDYFPEALATYELLGQIAEGEERDEIGRWKQMWRSAFRGGGGGERRDDRREHGRQGPDDARAARDRGEASGRPAPAAESDAPRPIWDAEAELDELLSGGAPEGDSSAIDDEGPDDLADADEEGAEAGPEATEAGPAQPGDEAGRKRRRRRRGGRRRRRGGAEQAQATGAAPLASDGQAVVAVAAARDDAGEP